MSFVPPIPDVVNAGNSTTALLIANAIFTGTPAIDCTLNPVSKVTVEAFSDVASAVGGLQIQFSNDGTNWDHVQTTTLQAGNSASVQTPVLARYVRVVYTNGTSPQATFRLQTMVSVYPVGSTVKDLDVSVRSDDSASLSRAILTGASAINPGKYTTVLTDAYGDLQVAVGGESADAFGRMRVAAPEQRFGAQFQYDTQPILFQRAFVGTGAVTKTANESSLTLSTGGTLINAQAINQTKEYFRYEPGKSQLVLMTAILGAQKTNVQQRIGYFDANDGAYFEMDGSVGASVNLRSSTSGSPVNTRVTQANWNIDPLDGSGPSGVTIDFSKGQIFTIDLQWLGVGRVRFGFFLNGAFVPCHYFYNANVVLLPYMNTANLPCRAEITNTGVAATTTTMKQICMAVVSEGGVENPQAYQFSASNASTLVTAGNGTRTPLVSIQPKLTFNSITNRTEINLADLEVYVSGANSIYWELVYNGTLTGTPAFASANAASAVNFDVAATGCTGGTVLASGYAASGGGGTGRNSVSEQVNPNNPFTLDISGANPDTLTLCATGIGGTAPSAGTLVWTEVR